MPVAQIARVKVTVHEGAHRIAVAKLEPLQSNLIARPCEVGGDHQIKLLGGAPHTGSEVEHKIVPRLAAIQTGHRQNVGSILAIGNWLRNIRIKFKTYCKTP